MAAPAAPTTLTLNARETNFVALLLAHLPEGTKVVVEMTEFGARHSHVDQEAIRGVPIFDIFADLRGEPKVNFDRFMSLAQTGATSVVTDLPYLVLGDDGKTANGWWNARTWPIVDDDQALLGFVEWAEPHTAPTHGGKTQVRLGRSVRA